MAKLYLVIGDTVTSMIETSDPDVTALPLIRSDQAASLLNEAHVQGMANRLSMTLAELIAALGLVIDIEEP